MEKTNTSEQRSASLSWSHTELHELWNFHRSQAEKAVISVEFYFERMISVTHPYGQNPEFLGVRSNEIMPMEVLEKLYSAPKWFSNTVVFLLNRTVYRALRARPLYISIPKLAGNRGITAQVSRAGALQGTGCPEGKTDALLTSGRKLVPTPIHPSSDLCKEIAGNITESL